MTMKLYEIDRQLERLVELDTERMVDTETGEILSVEALEQLQMDRLEKIEGCLLVIKNKEAASESIDKEIKKLQRRKKTLDNKVKWLRSYVANSLNGEKFETARVVVSYIKSESVEVTCAPEQLPKEYVTVTLKPALTPLKEAIKNGAEIAGVQIVTKQNLQVN